MTGMQVPAFEISPELFLTLDPLGKTFVRFQRPSRREREQLQSIIGRQQIEWTTDTTYRQKDVVPQSVLDGHRVAMTLVECNLRDRDDEKKLLFEPGVSCRAVGQPLTNAIEEEFRARWDLLPDPLAEDLAKLLHEWHPPFDWRHPSRGEAFELPSQNESETG